MRVARRLQPFAGSSDVRVLGGGQLSVAVLAGDIVLRFPRSEFAREHLRRDVAVIRRLTGVIDARVPDVIEADLDGDLKEAFVAHRYLRGRQLTSDAVEALNAAAFARVARSVGAFLCELHGAADAVTGVALPVMSTRQVAGWLRKETEVLLHPRMSAAGRRRSTGELDAMSALPDGPLRLCHTDIGGAVVFDDESDEIAFIDFGSAMITDPVLDVASLSVLGDAFVDACASAYLLIAERKEHAAIVRATFALQDALYGARQGDWDYVDGVIEWYEK